MKRCIDPGAQSAPCIISYGWSLPLQQFRSGLIALLAALLLLGAVMPQRAQAACTPKFKEVVDDGFGDRFNIYAWSMQVFNGDLYVGTLNNIDGGQIWRYDGSAWTKVLSQDALVTGNTGFRSLIEFNGYLYAGGYNTVLGAELWRTADGTNWEEVKSGGFGNYENQAVRGVAVFNNYLYVGLQNQSGTGGQLWRSADGVNFTPITQDGFGDPTNNSIHNMVVFNNRLYVGTKNTEALQIWRSSDGVNFTPVVGGGAALPGGFGVLANTQVMHMYVYNSRMFVGTGNNTVGFSVLYTPNGVNYQPVTVNGFGDYNNLFAWRFIDYQNYLWLGIGNFNIPAEGGQVMRSADGMTNWETMVGPGGQYYTYGFGDWRNWGVRSFAVYKRKLYVGTAQCWEDQCTPYVTGLQIWKWNGESCRSANAADPAKEEVLGN